jgi:hypothetical protein
MIVHLMTCCLLLLLQPATLSGHQHQQTSSSSSSSSSGNSITQPHQQAALQGKRSLETTGEHISTKDTVPLHAAICSRASMLCSARGPFCSV